MSSNEHCPGPISPVLRLNGIAITRQGQVVIRDASLDCWPGQVCALLGSNGSGRTTIAEAIAGLIPIHRGTMMLGELDLNTLRPHSRVAAGCRLVRDRGSLFPNFTVQHNIELWDVDVQQNLEEYLQLLPNFQSMLTRKAGTLSGGEKRIIAILTAILSGPPFLVIDEFTEGLHPSALALIGAKLQAFVSQGSSALVMVHSREGSLQLGYGIAELRDGCIIEDRSDTALER